MVENIELRGACIAKGCCLVPPLEKSNPTADGFPVGNLHLGRLCPVAERWREDEAPEPSVVEALRDRRRSGLAALNDEPGTSQHLVEGEDLST
jgi:hypothetical protein